MADYAVYDPATTDVIGWKENFPDGLDVAGSNLLAVTPEQTNNVRAGGRWIVSGDALLPYVPTLAEQATAALAAGFTITSTSTPVLNGTFAVDGDVQSHIQAEITALMLSGQTGTPTFADQGLTVDWPDLASPPVNHTMTVAEFKVFAGLIGAYVATLFKVKNGTVTALPPASVTIA
jgi:hypothetical protein